MIEVSIVISTFNRVNLLEKTLKSLFKQQYPYNKYEIIVCDGGSTESTEYMLNELVKIAPCSLKYLKQEDLGPASARNMGINQAEGAIIGFTDDDCIVSDTWISNSVSYFKDPYITGVQGATYPIEEISNKKKLFSYAKTIHVTELDNTYPTCNIFYRKDALIEVGGFDPNFRLVFLEDADIAYRLLEKKYKIVFASNVVIHHIVTYVPLINYLKSLKRIENIGLLVKKNPSYRENFTFGFIYRKEHIYPSFLILSIGLFLFDIISYLMFAIVIFVASYLWGRVIIDNNIKKYPLRIAIFFRYILFDSLGLYHTLRGSIKYKTFII